MPKTLHIPAIAVAALVALLAVPISVGAPGPGFGGAVLDAAGLPLADVQVYLGRAGEPILSSLTDAQGEFLFRELPPGRYTLLALKRGYQAASSSVNTLVHDSLDLTLRVLGEPAQLPADPARLPEDRNWVLRLPARDLLRDLEPGAVLQATTQPAEDETGIRAELRQWYSVGWGREGNSERGADEGTATELAMAGNHGQAVAWAVAGQLNNVSLQFHDSSLASRRNESEQLQVNVSLVPAARSQVDLSAYFDQMALSYDLVEAEGAGGGDRDSQVWGYDAGWRTQLADGSDLDVQVGYGSARLEDTTGALTEPDRADQRWRALGSYSFSPAERHQLEVGLRADVYDLGSEAERLTLSPEMAPASLLGSGDRGWTLNIFGRESFTLARPLALNLGIDYHHVGFEERVAYIVPQAGVTYHVGPGQTLRALVTVKLTDASGAPAAEAEAEGAEEFDSSRSVGYHVSWERELAGDLSLAVAASVRPFLQENQMEEGRFFRPARGGALFVSDGNASARDLSFRLEKRLRLFQGATGVRIGDVEGSLLSYLPNAIPSQSAGHNLARFVSTTLQTSIVPTGTSIQIDYYWVENDSLHFGDSLTSPLTYSSLDMMLQQDLKLIPGRAAWKVLLGYREVVNRSEDDSELALARLGIAEQVRRVSGGLSVRF